jgi:hypothetical protein
MPMFLTRRGIDGVPCSHLDHPIALIPRMSSRPLRTNAGRPENRKPRKEELGSHHTGVTLQAAAACRMEDPVDLAHHLLAATRYQE